jgi:XapX domain-containing protein
MKAAIGLVLAFALGFACRTFQIPSPAPPMVLGALLVVAMTVGYIAVDHMMEPGAGHIRRSSQASEIASPQAKASCAESE